MGIPAENTKTSPWIPKINATYRFISEGIHRTTGLKDTSTSRLEVVYSCGAEIQASLGRERLVGAGEDIVRELVNFVFSGRFCRSEWLMMLCRVY